MTHVMDGGPSSGGKRGEGCPAEGRTGRGGGSPRGARNGGRPASVGKRPTGRGTHCTITNVWVILQVFL